MMIGGSGARIQMMQHQADVTLSQANPVSGTKYTVLPTTTNVRIIGASASVTWTVQPTPLEVHATVDGKAIVYITNNPVSAIPYFPYAVLENADAGQGGGTNPAGDLRHRYAFEQCSGRSVKIEAETTGGTTSDLSSRVKYAKIP